jgi:hypothetical protein
MEMGDEMDHKALADALDSIHVDDWGPYRTEILHALRSSAPEATPVIPVEWHEMEKAAFEAWWASRGDHKFGEPPHLAAGTAWFARAGLLQPPPQICEQGEKK